MWLSYIWYQIKIRFQITVPAPIVAWTRAWLLQGGGGALPHCWEALGSGSSSVQCPTAREQWVVVHCNYTWDVYISHNPSINLHTYDKKCGVVLCGVVWCSGVGGVSRTTVSKQSEKENFFGRTCRVRLNSEKGGHSALGAITFKQCMP